MDKIIFNEKEYSIRDIYIPNYGTVTISSLELDDCLMKKDGTYVSREARYVDEQIFFFVEQNDLALSASALSKKIRLSL